MKFKKPRAKLLWHSPIWAMVYAARTSHGSEKRTASTDKEWDKRDKELIYTLVIKGHLSILEHLVFCFELEFPRSVLQELSRHRIGISPTVRSSRFTLHKTDEIELYDTGSTSMNETLQNHIFSLVSYKKDLKFPNDTIKAILPEGVMTKGVYTINARALRNLFELRTGSEVYKPFRELMWEIWKEIPDTLKFLFEDVNKMFGKGV